MSQFLIHRGNPINTLGEFLDVCERVGVEKCLELLRDCGETVKALGGSNYRTAIRLIITALLPYEEREELYRRYGVDGNSGTK